jgi:hypothetical protein
MRDPVGSLPAAHNQRSVGGATEPVRVLYIGGTGRTGSTLLTDILGQYPQLFAAGEMAFIWRFGFLGEGRCGCGLVLQECPVWKAIFGDAFGGGQGVDAQLMMRLRRNFNSNHLPLMFSKKACATLLERTGVLPATLESLYRGIASATGSRVIVDSSKEPHYSYILRTIPSLEVFFLHLVRDPRAVAYSWKHNRKRETGLTNDAALMETRGSATSAAYFDVSNIAAELMWARSPDHYMFLRYEDFLKEPEETIRTIGRFVGEDLDPGRVIADRVLTLGPTHTAWGNPNRFEKGAIALKADDSWKTSMPLHRRVAVTALTLPLVKRYRYPMNPIPSVRSTPPDAKASLPNN